MMVISLRGLKKKEALSRQAGERWTVPDIWGLYLRPPKVVHSVDLSLEEMIQLFIAKSRPHACIYMDYPL